MAAPTSLHWQDLCASTGDDELGIADSIEELQEAPVQHDPKQVMPTSLAEVEMIRTMRFDPTAHMDQPKDLFTCGDGTTATKLRDEYHYIFEHSVSASFFAYLPLYFWKQVTHKTNTYARVNQLAIGEPFKFPEIMKFLGILFYMEITVKGEYANYWGRQAEEDLFGSTSIDLEHVMPLKRFKLLRQSFSFRGDVSVENAMRDPAARIRTLLNVMKVTGGKYVELGRNVALDEASVACRSRFGRHLIVYNPRKPGGKYHFKLYMMCCASSWVAVNFRLHCESVLEDRLQGVRTVSETTALREELSHGAAIRQIVLEVFRPIYASKRIVNTDNFYTSVQLLQALKLKGLYGRGTVRGSSKHFPKHVMLEKGNCTRGEYRLGVSVEHQMLGASWCDGSIVSIVRHQIV